MALVGTPGIKMTAVMECIIRIMDAVGTITAYFSRFDSDLLFAFKSELFPAWVALVTKGQRVEPCLPQANRYLPRHDPLVALLRSQHIIMSHFLSCARVTAFGDIWEARIANTGLANPVCTLPILHIQYPYCIRAVLRSANS
jgi:hypothetical protein